VFSSFFCGDQKHGLRAGSYAFSKQIASPFCRSKWRRAHHMPCRAAVLLHASIFNYWTARKNE